MVRLPKGTHSRKNIDPNILNADGSITINGVTYNTGDKFTFACVATSNCWGKMFRDATIKAIDTVNEMVTIEGTSDWKQAEGTFPLASFV